MDNIELPVLKFGADNETIATNRQKIEAFQLALKAALLAAEGLHQANRAFCTHQNKKAEYDPGYAGGGFSNYRCSTCGHPNC